MTTLATDTVSQMLEAWLGPLGPVEGETHRQTMQRMCRQWLALDQVADPHQNRLAAESNLYRTRIENSRMAVEVRLATLLKERITPGWTPQNELALYALLADWLHEHEPDERVLFALRAGRLDTDARAIWWLSDLTKFVGGLIRTAVGLEH